jgi:hypothetical protein
MLPMSDNEHRESAIDPIDSANNAERAVIRCVSEVNECSEGTAVEPLIYQTGAVPGSWKS